MDSKLGVGLIGAGFVSEVHAEAYLEDERVKLLAVCDTNCQIAEKFARKYNIEKFLADYDVLLEDKNIKVIDICLPHYLHREVTIKALRAGKDVILEKPISMTVEEADEMIEVARKERKRFLVALNQRFLPCHQKAKELIDSGSLGNIFLGIGIIIGDEMARMNIEETWKGSWDEAGGGALADTGTHLVDLFLWWFGEPKKIMCHYKRSVVEYGNKGDDNACVIFEFPEDILASLTVTYSATADEWSEKKDIYGTKASLHIENENETPLIMVKDKKLCRPVPVEHPQNAKDWWTWSVKRGIKHLIDCIVNDKEPLVTPEDARRTLAVIRKCYRAKEEGVENG